MSLTSRPEGRYQREVVQDLDTFKFPGSLSQAKHQDEAGATESLTFPPHSQIYLKDISEQKDTLSGFLSYSSEAYIACLEASLSNRLPEQWWWSGHGSISQNPPYLSMVCSKQTRHPWLQEVTYDSSKKRSMSLGIHKLQVIVTTDNISKSVMGGQMGRWNQGTWALDKKDMVMFQDNGVYFLRLRRRESLNRNRGGHGTQSPSSRVWIWEFGIIPRRELENLA